MWGGGGVGGCCGFSDTRILTQNVALLLGRGSDCFSWLTIGWRQARAFGSEEVPGDVKLIFECVADERN